MTSFWAAFGSGILMLLACWGAWKFLNYISPVDDGDD